MFGEQIPLNEIERILDLAEFHLDLYDVVSKASAVYQPALTAYTSPTPIPFQLSFDGVGAPIPPITINAWDVILDGLSQRGIAPTRAGYTFQGWYLDSDLTVEITDIFRMPARNATLYARWEIDETPIEPGEIFEVTFHHEFRNVVEITVAGTNLISGDIALRLSGDVMEMAVYIDGEPLQWACCCDAMNNKVPFNNATEQLATIHVAGSHWAGNVATVYIEIYLNGMPTGHITYIFDSSFR